MLESGVRSDAKLRSIGRDTERITFSSNIAVSSLGLSSEPLPATVWSLPVKNDDGLSRVSSMLIRNGPPPVYPSLGRPTPETMGWYDSKISICYLLALYLLAAREPESRPARYRGGVHQQSVISYSLPSRRICWSNSLQHFHVQRYRGVTIGSSSIEGGC